MRQNQLEFNASGVQDDSYMGLLKDKFNKGGIITQTELGKIVPRQQFQVMLESKEEYPSMIQNISEAYANIPPLYAQDGKGKNAVVWLHYFAGGSDWFITELDKKENRAFGYVVLNGDVQMSEFGYVDINELLPINLVNLDLYWSVQTLNQAFQNKGYPMLVQEPIEIYQAVEEVEVVEDSNLLDVKFDNVFERNLAIRELVDEKGDNTNNYTVEEKEFISQYSGMGGLEKYGATGKGLLYEYYTPNDIIEKMWGLCYKHKKIEIKNVIEPSCGVGRFLGQAPQAAGLNFECWDIDKYALTIAKVLYNNDDSVQNNNYNFYLGSFESKFIDGKNKSIGSNTSSLENFDLVIGNPPYGKYSGMYAGMGEKKATGATSFVEYFISRGLDVLKKDGLLIYIIGTVTKTGGIHFLDKKPNNIIDSIMDKSELVDAYRLGMGVFDTTDVDSEIIVLRKK